MSEKTFKVNVDERTVSFKHTTKTLDGSIDLTTTFDFSKVGLERLLYDAGSARLIKWRASSGIKDMPTKQAKEEFTDLTVDCSVVAERKSVALPEDLKEILAALKGMTPEQRAAHLAAIKEAAAEEDKGE